MFAILAFLLCLALTYEHVPDYMFGATYRSGGVRIAIWAVLSDSVLMKTFLEMDVFEITTHFRKKTFQC